MDIQELKDLTRSVTETLSSLPNITVEICGSWIWVSGDTKSHKEILKSLKMRWHRKKHKWYWRPPNQRHYAKKRNDTPMPQIRLTYGSQLLPATEED